MRPIISANLSEDRRIRLSVVYGARCPYRSGSTNCDSCRPLRQRSPSSHGQQVGSYPGSTSDVTLPASPRAALRPSHVWSIRTKLQIEGKKRDLALFNLAIDNKLRGPGCGRRSHRRRRAEWLLYGSREHPPKEDRQTRPIWAGRPDAPSHRRVLRLTERKPGQSLFAGRGDRSLCPTTTSQSTSIEPPGGNLRARARTPAGGRIFHKCKLMFQKINVVCVAH